MQLMQIEWNELRAVIPTPHEVTAHAQALSAAYNEPRNATLMGHEHEISPAGVIDTYRDMFERGGHPFLLFCDDVLAGDADLRGVRDGSAEFAFLIAAPSAQGKGLGTRFAIMLHTFGFRHLQLVKIYASIVPENVASRRVFEKLGYVIDTSAAARAYADEPTDVTLALDHATFEQRHAEQLAQIHIRVR
jgi:RimJ/RimL family protein N-acetyltransferase